MQGLSFDTYCLKDHTAQAPFEQHEVSSSRVPLSSSAWKERGILFLIALPLFLALYGLFRAPTSDLGLAYYDDGETLYHAFATNQGLVPYRDNYNHHFLGYIIPFLITGSLTNDWMLSFTLVRGATIVLSALLLFVLVRRWTRLSCGILAGSLLLSAREPWVLAFFQQYQINLFIILGWVLLARFLTKTRGSSPLLGYAGVIYGCAFVFDQRALLLLSIPFFVIMFRSFAGIGAPGELFPKKQERPSLFHLLKDVLTLSAGFCAPVVACLIYLWNHDAFTSWFQQTIYYPFFFRAAPLPFSDKLKVWCSLYMHLPTQSPFLFVTGLVGLIALFLTKIPPHLQPAKLLIASSLPALFFMPLMGGRDFDYYTITWFPLLALTATVATQLFKERALMRRMHSILLSAALLIPLIESITNLPSRSSRYSGDGIEEVVSYLQASGASRNSVYLWGYRLELYVHLGQVSPLPFASRIFIHPDQQFPENREERVYPLYRDRFFNLLNSKPPEYIIWFTQDSNPELPSLAEDALRKLVQGEFREVYTLTKPDFRGHWSSYKIYRKT